MAPFCNVNEPSPPKDTPASHGSVPQLWVRELKGKEVKSPLPLSQFGLHQVRMLSGPVVRAPIHRQRDAPYAGNKAIDYMSPWALLALTCTGFRLLSFISQRSPGWGIPNPQASENLSHS